MKKMSISIVKLNSLAVAILCTNALIFNVISIALNYDGGFYITTFFAISLIAISCILSRNTINKKRAFNVGILIALIMLLFLVSGITGRLGDIGIVSIVGYCIVPLVCSLLTTQTDKILEYIMAISLIALPFTGQLFSYQYVSLQQTDMSRAYAVLVVVIAAILHFIWYRKQSSKFVYLFYIADIYLMINLVSVANRGVILSLIFLGFIILFRYIKEYDIPQKQKRKFMLLLCVLSIACILIIINIEATVVGLYNFFETKMSSTPSFVLKMYNLIVYRSDISNGRGDVYSFFTNAVLQNPIFGYGMEMSKRVSSGRYPYPHNYILQLLFEGGIIFAAYPIYISIRLVYQTVCSKVSRRNDEILAVFLLCNCIPKLIISGNIWNQTIFWIWLGFAASNILAEKRIGLGDK